MAQSLKSRSTSKPSGSSKQRNSFEQLLFGREPATLAAWVECMMVEQGLRVDAFSIAEGDTDDIQWALSTGAAKFDQGGVTDSVVWLRRAAETADKCGLNERAAYLRAKAELLIASLWDAPSASAEDGELLDDAEELDEFDEIDVDFVDAPQSMRPPAPRNSSKPAPPRSSSSRTPLRAPPSPKQAQASLKAPPLKAPPPRPAPPRQVLSEQAISEQANAAQANAAQGAPPTISVGNLETEEPSTRQWEEVPEPLSVRPSTQFGEEENSVHSSVAADLLGAYVESSADRSEQLEVESEYGSDSDDDITPLRVDEFDAPAPAVQAELSPEPSPLSSEQDRMSVPVPLQQKTESRSSSPPISVRLQPKANPRHSSPPISVPLPAAPRSNFPPALSDSAGSADSAGSTDSDELPLFSKAPSTLSESTELGAPRDEMPTLSVMALTPFEEESSEEVTANAQLSEIEALKSEEFAEEFAAKPSAVSAAEVDITSEAASLSTVAAPEAPTVAASASEEAEAPELSNAQTEEVEPNIEGIILADVPGFRDLPDEAQIALAQACEIRELNEDEEVAFFGAALVLRGAMSLIPSVSDCVAAVVPAAQIVFTQGSLAQGIQLSALARGNGTRVAVWDEATIASAFEHCPWVLDELAQIADRYQALAGATFGPLGDQMDESLRDSLLSVAQVRSLLPEETLLEDGSLVQSFMIVGAGHVLLGDGSRLSPGDFIFSSQMLSAQSAPSSVTAEAHGALILEAPRSKIHELMISMPPLLEMLATA